jgi:cell division protease FtsH
MVYMELQRRLTQKTLETLAPDMLTNALAKIVKDAVERDHMGKVFNSLRDKHGNQARTTKRTLSNGQYLSVALSLAEDLRKVANLAGYDGLYGGSAPVWGTFVGPDHEVEYPLQIAAELQPGTITPFECVLYLQHASETTTSDKRSVVGVITGPEDVPAAQEWLRRLIDRAEADFDVLRNRVVRVDTDASRTQINYGLAHKIVKTPSDTLEDVVVTEEVRAEIQRNVLDHVRAKHLMERAGLGSNRGILLWGPPGTGKTSLVRGIIRELAGEVTVLLASPRSLGDNLVDIYAEAERLAPSIVVLEDIDNITSSRGGGLLTLLASLDGVVKDHTKLVVTIATTNDPRSIDEAAKRPGRIDRFVEVALPDAKIRLKILEHYFAKLTRNGITNDLGSGILEKLAANSEGASGALLREVVRRSLLIASAGIAGHEVVIDEKHLAEASLEIGYRIHTPPTGQYI